jgi:excisionase family DNA binding protein
MRGMDVLTCDQAAEEYGASARYIRQEIQLGRLKAQKIGRDWVILRRDFNAWKNSKTEKEPAK